MSEPAPYGAYTPTGLVAWLIARTRAASGAWASRRLSFLLRRIAVRRLRGRPVDIETLGARMRLYPYNNVCEKRILFTPQFFDPQERALIEERIRPGFVFIDIGANVGAYALFVAAHAGNDARIVAVEPQPDVFDRLVYNIRLNGFSVKAMACALADKPGELTLFLSPRNSGETSMKIVPSAVGAAIRVPATTLADLVRDEGFERVDAVKLDVEGAEDIILEPFFRQAPEHLWPSLLIVEDGTGRWQIDLPRLLAEKGYVLLAHTRLNLVFERAKGRHGRD